MTLLQAIILGVIQGAAEFLPISSSGHLVICKNFFGLQMDNTYDILLHFGTLIAVFIAYWKDIKELIWEGICIVCGFVINAAFFVGNLFKKDKRKYIHVINSPYRRFVMMVIISTIPTGILGVVLEKIVGNAANGLLLPGICLLVTSGILMLSSKYMNGKKDAATATYTDAVIVGTVQGVATLPGISRSGSTIVAATMCGFTREFAVKYSFIMSIPAILGAVVLDLGDMNKLTSPAWYYATGTVVAGVVGFVCIKTLLKVVKSDKFSWFAYYCVAMGFVSIIGYFVLR